MKGSPGRPPGCCSSRDCIWPYELRRLKGSSPRAFHSFLIAPGNTTFHSTGDDSAPIALSPDGERVVFGAGDKLWTQSHSADGAGHGVRPRSNLRAAERRAVLADPLEFFGNVPRRLPAVFRILRETRPHDLSSAGGAGG